MLAGSFIRMREAIMPGTKKQGSQIGFNRTVFLSGLCGTMDGSVSSPRVFWLGRATWTLTLILTASHRRHVEELGDSPLADREVEDASHVLF